MNKTRYVFIDTETTGLDADTCKLIQIAAIITDGDLNEIDSFECPIYQSPAVLAEMAPFVRKMHTKNGLLERIPNADKDTADAETSLIKLVMKYCAFKKALLGGNSVHFDRKFLEKHMPSLINCLHYRQIDVSSLGVLAKEWDSTDPGPQKGESTHTALEDIRACLFQLKYYKNRYFN